MDKGWKKVTIVKPVQDGGTLVSLIPLFRRAVDQYQSVVLAYPTLDSAKDIWTTKVLPIMRAFGGIEPTSGGGSQGGAARVVSLPTGGHFILRAAGGAGENQQASITGDCVQIDEVDDWKEIHRIRLISLRIEEAPDPLIIEISTVKLQLDSHILAEYAMGTQSRLMYACADCGRYQFIEWKNVIWDQRDNRVVPDSERLICQSCGVHHNEHGRRIMLANWKLVHGWQTVDEHGNVVTIPGKEVTTTDKFSIIWTRLESPRKTMATTVSSYVEAKHFLEMTGDHGSMKSFFQDYMCQPYTGDIDELDAGGILKAQQLSIKSAMSDYGPSVYTKDPKSIDLGNNQGMGLWSMHVVSHMPEEAHFTAGTIDVQHDRVYWVLTAVNKDTGTTWDTCWGIEFGRFDRKACDENEMYMLFDRVATRMRGLSCDLPFMLGGIDCGDQTDIVRRWVAANYQQRWRAVRGDGGNKTKLQPEDIDGISYVREGVIYVQVDEVRDHFHAAIRRPIDAPGAVIFPSGIDANNAQYFRHLCSKQTSIDPKTKKKIILKGKGREDWLDCRIYLTALVIGLLMEMRMKDNDKKVADAQVVKKNEQVMRVEQPEETKVVQQNVRPSSVPFRIGGHMTEDSPRSPSNRRSYIGNTRRWR